MHKLFPYVCFSPIPEAIFLNCYMQMRIDMTGSIGNFSSSSISIPTLSKLGKHLLNKKPCFEWRHPMLEKSV